MSNPCHRFYSDTTKGSSVNIETLRSTYPKLFSKVDDEIDELRYLLVIDENFNDVDSDEFDAIDPEDYNYLVYVTERLQEALGEEGMVTFIKLLEAHKNITLFYLSDVDLYGIQTDLDDEGIAKMILEIVETIV
jgi:hypothetical protein